MTKMQPPIALNAFEELAYAYARIAETKAENGYNEHPAIRSKIGDVSGLTVLDAGCGPGFLVRDLNIGGAARVVGFDISPTMIKIARETAGDAADLFVGDLAEPIDLPSATFDLIVSSLAIDYVRDWSVPLAEFKRLLKGEGRFVFSVQHPMGAYRWYSPPSAFGVHLCKADWAGFTDRPVTVPDYYRSFEEIITPLLSAGFTMKGFYETKPVEALRELNPNKYRRGSTFPTFIVIDAFVDNGSN